MKTHLFGEMDLNLKLPVHKVFREAKRISECCGYVTTTEKGIKDRSRDRIEIFGEDCTDSLQVVSVLYIENNKIAKVQKVVYLLGSEGQGESFKSWKQLKIVYEIIDKEWKEIFNSKKVMVVMPKEYDV